MTIIERPQKRIRSFDSFPGGLRQEAWKMKTGMTGPTRAGNPGNANLIPLKHERHHFI
jgi:hypothetical protein